MRRSVYDLEGPRGLLLALLRTTAAMRLSPLLRPDLVLPRLEAASREDVLVRLAETLVGAGLMDDPDEVVAALTRREEAHTTAIGHGMALPHATLAELEGPVMMVALADPPIAFGPEGSELVGLFFSLLSPPGNEARHIKLLARICRLARHPGFAESVRSAASAEGVVDVIRHMDEEHQ